MARVGRRARVEWAGNLGSGGGKVSLGSRGILEESPVAWASRTEQPGGKTYPGELMAAAHSSCYAMAPSVTLAEEGNEPEQLSVEATCAFDNEVLKVSSVDLEVRGAVEGISQEDFQEFAAQAEELCPVSNAIRGNVEVRVDARLS
ncbi:MAG: OsmC family peroxiredoxin [Rubrobacter sp.]|nr:OsmC family peroxiredoxin [Rubrobacter sp.]